MRISRACGQAEAQGALGGRSPLNGPSRPARNPKRSSSGRSGMGKTISEKDRWEQIAPALSSPVWKGPSHDSAYSSRGGRPHGSGKEVAIDGIALRVARIGAKGVSRGAAYVARAAHGASISGRACPASRTPLEVDNAGISGALGREDPDGRHGRYRAVYSSARQSIPNLWPTNSGRARFHRRQEPLSSSSTKQSSE